MIDSIQINNFRSIENLKIENFKNVNIFFGKANTAKTSILEALHLFLKEDTSALKDISDNRFNLLDDIIESLFLDYNTSQAIRISNNDKNLKIVKSSDRKIQITNGDRADIKSVAYTFKIWDKDPINGLFSITKNQIEAEIQTQEISNKENQSVFIGSFKLNNRFYRRIKQALLDNELENELNKYCKDFDSQIEGISVIDKDIYVKILEHNKKINLKVMGQSFISYLSYIVEILNKTRYFCIDNLETGLHFEHIDLILKIILEQSIQNDIQFFITTHSLEVLDQLAKIAVKNSNFRTRIACFNIFKEVGKIKTWENKIDGFIINMENGNEIRI